MTHLDSMITLLDLASDDIPIPEYLDLVPLIALHPSEEEALRALSTIRMHYLDLIAFYCWIHLSLGEDAILKNWYRNHAVPAAWKTWEKAPKTGYLLDLGMHALTHSLPSWCQLGVPVHYSWDPVLAATNRFREWSPEVLNALDELQLGVEPARMQQGLEGEQRAVDEWTQEWDADPTESQEGRTPYDDLIGWTFYVEDFEGWTFRQVELRRELDTYELQYSSTDSPDSSPPSQTYHRYRLRPGFVTSEDGRMGDDSPLLPLSLTRERFKFRYGTPLLQQEVPKTTRTLLSRIGQKSERSGSGSGSVSPRGRSREVVLRQRHSGAYRERSASPLMNRITGSDRRLQKDALGYRRGNPEGSKDSSTRATSRESGARSPTSYSSTSSVPPSIISSHRGRDAALSLLPRTGEQPYPFDFTNSREWNREFLEEAVIHFPAPNAQWRIRSWRVQDPDVPITILLSRALSYFIPFQLEVPMEIMHRFMRTKASCSYRDTAAGIFYKSNYIGNLIQYTKIGVNYVAAYKTSALGVLAKPNAPAFLFQGGILARLAYYFGGPALVEQATRGLSTGVTLHGAGFTSIDRGTKREEVTDYDKMVLVGYSETSGPQTEPHYLFPPEHVFNECFLPYDLEWTEYCERWFMKVMATLDNNAPVSRTESGWRTELRMVRKALRIDDRTWKEAREEIMAVGGPSWEGARVRDLHVLDFYA
ncbi:hypothetical protein HWV62_42836 [Athelia sp. TMB]|nr:hypothetical protein HWV62_42836 [Athelia sp. TMB]